MEPGMIGYPIIKFFLGALFFGSSMDTETAFIG